MRIAIAAAIFALLTACSAEPEPESDGGPEPTADQQPDRDHFLSDQYKALDDAKKLQDDMNAQVEKRLKDLDEQTKAKKDDD